MAARTTTTKVEAILLDQYDGTSSLSAFIDTATLIVDRLVVLDEDSVLGAAILERIECYLAAHFYGHADQFLSEEKKGRSGGTYQGQTAMQFNSTQYGQAALSLDFSGNLATLGKRQPRMMWIGLPPSEQTEYKDRD